MTTNEIIHSSGQRFTDVGLHEKITAIKSLTDKQYYPIDKLQAHVENIRHVAISIFITEGDRLLLQRRAASKYHSPGLWANSVCTHPRWGESPEDCAARRLSEELGWQVPLTKFAEISYQAQVGNLFENEHVHCFYGSFDNNDIDAFNPLEVSAVQWLTLTDIRQQVSTNPQQFSAWFKIYMQEQQDLIASLMN